jgi:lysozyme
MILDAKGRAFIQENEGLRLKTYLDGGGVPTIGYGTIMYPSGESVKLGDVCTKYQADLYFANDAHKFEWIVNKYALLSVDTQPLTQPKFNALVSLVYNIGGTNFAKSTLLKLVNSKERNNREVIELAFLSWNKIRIDGVLTVSQGLTNRRKKEVDLYFS